MKLWLIKTDKGFLPLYDIDKDVADKIPLMEENLFEIKRVRNSKHHRKYFSMVKMCFDNQDEFSEIDTFRKVNEMRAGYYEIVNTDKGVMHWPKSIAFEKLDQTDFEELYNKFWAVMFERYSFDREDFESELMGYG